LNFNAVSALEPLGTRLPHAQFTSSGWISRQCCIKRGFEGGFDEFGRCVLGLANAQTNVRAVCGRGDRCEQLAKSLEGIGLEGGQEGVHAPIIRQLWACFRVQFQVFSRLMGPLGRLTWRLLARVVPTDLISDSCAPQFHQIIWIQILCRTHQFCTAWAVGRCCRPQWLRKIQHHGRLPLGFG